MPVDKRREFIERYLDEIRRVRSEMVNVRKQMELEGRSPTRDDFVNAGLGLVQLSEMKFAGFAERGFKHDLSGNRIPDFVFYLPTNLDKEITEKIKSQILESISAILATFEQEDPELPRYSTPYTSSDGKVHTSLSYTQGDSDFKNYLKRIGKLDLYFDKDQNYAVAL